MNTRKISWEIVLAGIAFVAVGIYLLNSNSTSSTRATSAGASPSSIAPPSPPKTPGLPSTFVIDLQNLENLENLKDLQNFEELHKLDIELKDLDSILKRHLNKDNLDENLNYNLKQLEQELQNIENADFNVKLQNRKVYINKDYNVDEAQWTEVSPGVFVFRQTFSAADLRSMDLNLGFGNVNIVGNGSQQAEITLRATGNLEDPAIFSEKIEIQDELVSPNAVFKVLSAPKSNISNQINLEATLNIPTETEVNAKTSGGHINVNNLNSRNNLHTSGGHLTLNNISGESVAKTGGGHITASQISGKSSLSTSGGHIKVNEANGSLSVQTGGGHIEIRDMSGSVSAKTSGGNISARIQQAEGPLKFITSAGNVSLFLPENIGAELDISGSAVHLSDIFNFNGTENQGNISGSINGGGIPITVNCGYGNVNINSNK